MHTAFRYGTFGCIIGFLYPPSIEVGKILALPLASPQIEVNLDALTFPEPIQLGAALLYCLKFDHLRVVAVGYFNDKFACLKTSRFLLCGE